MDLIKNILSNENIPFNNIVKSEVGFSNDVFFIDDKFVLKIAKKGNEKLLNKEILFYKNVSIDCMPEYVCSNSFNGIDYLIIKKLKGKSLYNLWHLFSDKKRKELIFSICQILKKLNNINYDFLPNEYKVLDWSTYIKKNLDDCIIALKNKNLDTSFLENFSKNYFDKYFFEQNTKFLYNDAHFDNFIYDGKNLFIIDFDRIFVGSLDYELLILDLMLDNPKKFASSEEEKFVNTKDYSFIRAYLKEFYYDLYNFKYSKERLFIYKFLYNLSAHFEYNNQNALINELNNFKIFFTHTLD